MTTAAGRWAAATASVRGASHDRDGKPNQDAVRVVQVKGAVPGLVAAVCDGHGGDRYVRSDVGSRFGVEVACDVGRRALDELGLSPTASTVEAHLSGVVAESIVERWRERVLDDVRRRAFTDDERVRAGASLEGDPHISYGCTLLLAILAPSWVGLLQIGDGDVTVVNGAQAESPVPDDDRLVAGETTSLCLPTAVADARVRVLLEPLPETLILTSDGYANSFASPSWRTDAGIDLRDHIQRIGLDGVEARLPAWLADSAIAGGDDVSMALIYRKADTPGQLSGGAASRAAPTSPISASTRRRPRRGLLAAVAVMAALAGAGAGWIVARADQPASEPGTTSSVVSTSTPSTTLPITTITTISPITTSTINAVSQIALTPGDEPLLLRGDSEGLLLTFNPREPEAARPRFFAWVKVVDWTEDVPEGWGFADGNLCGPDGCYPALVVGQADKYVWAVGFDRQTLTSYDPTTGKALGCVTIPGSRGDEVVAADVDPCAATGDRPDSTAAVTQAGAAGSDVQGDIGQGE